MYELWDIESGNLVGNYIALVDALAIVRGTAERFGDDAVLRLALGREDDGVSTSIAGGSALIELARRPESLVRSA